MPTEGPAQDASEAVLDDLAQLTAQVQDVLGDVWRRPVEDGPLLGSMADGVWQATAAFQQSLLEHPTRLLQAQVSLWEAYWAIWQRGLQVAGGDPATECARSIGDRRFRAADWRLPAFDMIRQCYLVTSNWLLAQVADTQDLEPQARRRLAFYTRQFADALSPSNFLATNPEVLRATAESGGQNLLQGCATCWKTCSAVTAA